MKLLHGISAFAKKETVLVIAAACAIVSMFFVKPDALYLSYIDYRVLSLLFALMCVTAGLQECGLFDILAHKLLSGKKSAYLLSLILVLLPFFSSMLVTNDVALITFVPFALLVLAMTGRTESAPYIIVLQTVAANLGSMATPVGNPQNLYLFAKYSMDAGSFFACVLPVAALSLLLIIPAARIGAHGTISLDLGKHERLASPRLAAMFGALFVLCLLSVFRVLHYAVPAAAALICCLAFSRKTLRRVDYLLLVTFICFFVFSGNMGRIDAVKTLLTSLLGRDALLTSAAASQVISNVPAAVLLSGFSQNSRALLLGTDIGGLGTPVASLASLISLKLYANSDGAKPGRYMALFIAANAIGLAVLMPFAYLLLSVL